MSKHVSRLFLRFILTQLLTCLRGQKIAPITLTAIAPLTQTIIFVGVLQNSYVLLTYKYQVCYIWFANKYINDNRESNIIYIHEGHLGHSALRANSSTYLFV